MSEAVSIPCPNCGASLPVSGDLNENYSYCEYCDSRIYIGQIQSRRRMQLAKERKDEMDARINAQKTLDEMEDQREQKRQQILREDEARLARAEAVLREHDEAERQRKKAEFELETARRAALKLELKRKELRRKNVISGILFTFLLIGIILAVIGFANLSDYDSFGSMFLVIGMWTALIAGVVLLRLILPDSGNDSDTVVVPDWVVHCKGMNYEKACSRLKESGFRNIQLEPMHDIVLGIFARKGRVASISVDGSDRGMGGKTVSADARVVIKYHSE